MTVEEALPIVRGINISDDEIQEALNVVADELEERITMGTWGAPIRPIKDWIPTMEPGNGGDPHYAFRDGVQPETVGHTSAVLMGPEGLCVCGSPFPAHGAFNACPDGSGTWRTKR